MTQVITNKPSSLEWKREEGFNVKSRWLYVHELKSMLEGFPDDSWVVVNKVGNINVYKENYEVGDPFSTIDMLWARVDHWIEVLIGEGDE